MKIYKLFINETDFHYVSGKDEKQAIETGVAAKPFGIVKKLDVKKVEEFPEQEWDNFNIEDKKKVGIKASFSELLEETPQYLASNFDW